MRIEDPWEFEHERTLAAIGSPAPATPDYATINTWLRSVFDWECRPL